MSGLSRSVRRQVIVRDQGRCICCGTAVVDPDTLTPWAEYSLQHRVRRGMGGSKDPAVNSPANAIVLCGTGTTACHGYVEHHPEWARFHGFAVPTWQDPALVPVRHFLYGAAFAGDTEWWPIPLGAEGTAAVAAHAARVVEARGLTGEDVTHISQALAELTADWIKEEVA